MSSIEPHPATGRLPKEFTGRGRYILLVFGFAALILLSTVLIVIAVLSARVSSTTVLAILSGQRHLNGSDRVLLITAEIAAAAFLLAVLAALFAILAYAVATRTPNIEVAFGFPGCAWNKPIVRLGHPDGDPGIPLLPKTETTEPFSVRVMFISKNRWPAEHLLLRVWLAGMMLPANWFSQNWDKTYDAQEGAPVTIFQLRDPYPRVYGQIPSHVWPLDFNGLRLAGTKPMIVYFVSGHGGYLRIRKIPVRVEKSNGEAGLIKDGSGAQSEVP